MSRRLYVFLAAADTALAATGRDKQRRLTKPLLMPTLLLGKKPRTQRALALGGLGDVALLGRSDLAFTAGLGSFLLSHLAWVSALRGREGGGFLQSRPATVVPYLAAYGGLNGYLWTRTGKDRIPVLVYSTALLAMSLVALDSGKPRTTLGGALFLASDSLLALEKFAGVTLPGHEALVMATYTSAQALLAAE